MADLEWNDGVLDELMAPGGAIYKDGLRRTIKAERRAKQLCAVDTGRARASITHSDGERSGDTLTFEIGSDVEYFPYLELGTSKMAARPCLRPGLDAAR